MREERKAIDGGPLWWASCLWCGVLCTLANPAASRAECENCKTEQSKTCRKCKGYCPSGTSDARLCSDCEVLAEMERLIDQAETPTERVLALFRYKYVVGGYLNSGCMSPSDIARRLQFTTAKIDRAIAELRARGLVCNRDCEAYMLELTPGERVRLIEEHDLSHKWEEVAWYFTPNKPYGEVGAAYREAAEAALQVAA